MFSNSVNKIHVNATECAHSSHWFILIKCIKFLELFMAVSNVKVFLRQYSVVNTYNSHSVDKTLICIL